MSHGRLETDTGSQTWFFKNKSQDAPGQGQRANPLGPIIFHLAGIRQKLRDFIRGPIVQINEMSHAHHLSDFPNFWGVY